MAPLQYCLLFLLTTSIASGTKPAVSSNAFATTTSGSSGAESAFETSVVTGPGGKVVTETETFVATTYPGYANLSTTVVVNTIITVHGDGASPGRLSTYSYQVGPGGVGWGIPTPDSNSPVLLPPPTFLPGQVRPTSRTLSSSSTPSQRGKSSATASGTTSYSKSSSPSASGQSASASSQSSSTDSSSSQSRATTFSRQNGTTSVTDSSIAPSTSASGFSHSVIGSGSTALGSSPTPSRASSIRSTSGPSKLSGSGIPISTASSAITSSITIPPTGFSAVTVSGSSYTANRWITTTDDDDHTTIVPLIVTGGGVGVIMWGLPPVPNTLFSFPGLPEFHLPCFRVFGASVGSCTKDPVTDDSPDGDEGTSDDPSSKTTKATKTSSKERTSSQCTATKTVSDCEVRCAKATSSNACASFTTTCSDVQTGCSVTGATSTVTSTSSACKTCSSCLGGHAPGKGVPPYQTSGPNADDVDELTRRDIAGRVRLERRGPKSIVAQLGACVLATGSASKLTRPPWPAVSGDMLNPEIAGKMKAKYSTISRYDRATRVAAGAAKCAVPTTTRLAAAAFMAAPPYTDYRNAIQKNNNDASLDHAYEKSWLKDFFVQLVGTTTGASKLACADLNKFFFPKAPAPGTCQFNVIQPAWNAIGSEKNLYFVAMSQHLNGDAKGMFFPETGRSFQQSFVGDTSFAINNKGGWKWPSSAKGAGAPYSAKDTLQTMIIYFEKVLLGVLEMKSDSMLSLIDRTNNRIYDALTTLDNDIRTNQGKLYPQAATWQTAFGAGGIAGAYKAYMDTTILPQITVPPAYLTKLWKDVIKPGIIAAENLPDVKTDSNKGSSPGPLHAEWVPYHNMIDAIDSLYLDPATGDYKWEYTFTFAYNRANTKREEGGDDGAESSEALSCPMPSKTASASASDRKTSSADVSTSSVSGSSSATSTKTGSSSSSSRGKTSSSARPSTTTQPPRVAAPDITIATPTEKPDCVQGWATTTMQAVASAPANAASLKFFVPAADGAVVSRDWEFELMPGFVVHPKTAVKSWSVGTSARGPLLASGKGGMDMNIKWRSPEKANGTYIRLLFTDPEPPIGVQTYGVVVKGGKSSCMPDACSGLPETTDENGLVCKKHPCSTQPTCSPGGPVSPRASCLVVEDGALVPLWYEVSIVTNDFVEADNGARLKDEEEGCGALASWKRHTLNERVPDPEDGGPDGAWTATYEFTFTLPITIKSGCVERAIASAGGPKGLRCVNTQSDWIFI